LSTLLAFNIFKQWVDRPVGGMEWPCDF